VGFFEIIVWLLAIGQIMQNLNNPACYIAYAGGFAMGNFVGISIAERLSLGVVLIRLVTKKDASGLVEQLKQQDYGVTSVDGHGTNGQVKVVFTVVHKGDVPGVIAMIKEFNPNAFYSIEEVRFVREGVFPGKKSGMGRGILRFFAPLRKAK
jgi:uncharacterized protein YebE (UPF0316 family)